MECPRPLPAVQPTKRIIGNCPAIDALRAQIRHLAPFDAVGHPAVPTVLLHGETGTGKGLVARVIHDTGPRAHGPFIDLNCTAIPETLLEAELYGFAAGAFTDAKRAKPGLFEAASGGTLFLDEIDALPLALQGKLLTVIEEKRVRRLGAVAERPVGVKLIAATQAELSVCVREGRFRGDLYQRLAVVLLKLPPLRAEPSDRVGAYTLVGLRPRPSPLAVYAQWPLSRFVGRTRELAVLEDLLGQVWEGRGQVVGVMGEPGVGESRLCYELMQAHAAHGWLILETRADSCSQATPYRPVIDLRKVYFQLDARDDLETIRKKSLTSFWRWKRPYSQSSPHS